MLLSFRGSEKQKPSLLQQALRFESILHEKKNSAELKHLSNDEALNKIIDDYNRHPGINAQKKWQVSRDGRLSICNLALNTTEACRDIMRNHLDTYKWTESCFNEMLLKSRRWLVGARPKLGDEPWEVLLTTTEDSQNLFMLRVVTSFVARAKRIRGQSKSKARWTLEEWDRNVDYTCLVCRVMCRARTTSVTPDVVEKIKDSFLMGCLACSECWSGLEAEFVLKQ